MKKIISLSLIFILICSFVACKSSNNNEGGTSSTASKQADAQNSQEKVETKKFEGASTEKIEKKAVEFGKTSKDKKKLVVKNLDPSISGYVEYITCEFENDKVTNITYSRFYGNTSEFELQKNIANSENYKADYFDIEIDDELMLVKSTQKAVNKYTYQQQVDYYISSQGYEIVQ